MCLGKKGSYLGWGSSLIWATAKKGKKALALKTLWHCHNVFKCHLLQQMYKRVSYNEVKSQYYFHIGVQSTQMALN